MRTSWLRRIGGLALACGLAFPPAGATAETLADALISAYRHSNLLEQNRAVLRAADEDVAVQLSALRPALDFVATYQHTDPQNGARLAAGASRLSQTYSLQASFTLFSNGQRGLALDSAKETVLATREALLQVEQDVLLTAVQAFFDVRSAQAVVDLRQNNVRLITQELRAARDRFEVGEVTRTDVALAESRLAAARSELAAAEGTLAVAREDYKAAVGRFPGALQAPHALPKIPARLEEAKSIGSRTHPAIRQAQREVTVAEINADIAGRAYGPTIDLDAAASVDDLLNDSLSVGLTMRQPIYRGGRLPALERQAMARRDASRAALHQTVVSVQNAVGASWAQLDVVGAQIQALDRQVTAARIAFDGTREEARLGARTTLDVLDAEQELLTAQANRVQAQNNRFVAVYSLLSAMGLLTVEHLKLGITTYDPAAYYNAVRSAPARASRQGERLDRVLERLGRE